MDNAEWCGNCSKPKPLIKGVGFCLECSRIILNFPYLSVCVKCDKPFDGRGQVRRICQQCERESWYAVNADKIENYIRAGLPFDLAVIKVAFDNRPLCQVCGNKIKGGREGWHLFCSESSDCKKAARRFKYYRVVKGMKREQALKEAMKHYERAA